VRARELLAPDQRQIGVLEVGDAVLARELGGRPGGGDLALVDEGDPVAELLGLLEVVGGEQDRRALLVDPLDVVPELEPQLDVDAGGRLISARARISRRFIPPESVLVRSSRFSVSEKVSSSSAARSRRSRFGIPK
jgi:hypothetical protein